MFARYVGMSDTRLQCFGHDSFFLAALTGKEVVSSEW